MLESLFSKLERKLSSDFLPKMEKLNAKVSTVIKSLKEKQKEVVEKATTEDSLLKVLPSYVKLRDKIQLFEFLWNKITEAISKAEVNSLEKFILDWVK